MNERKSAEMLREVGKAYFFKSEGNTERKNEGLQMLIKAQQQGDPEAPYIISRLIFDGFLSVSQKDSQEFALVLMCTAANKGFVQARSFLNMYCDNRYKEKFKGLTLSHNVGPLVDFDGNPISIVRKGLLTPIDVVLEYKDGKNVLTISTNIMFTYSDEIKEPDKFEDSIIKGLQLWQGDYEVFGGQKVTVVVKITTEPQLFDNVIVMPITSEIEDTIKSVSQVLGTSQSKSRVKEMLLNKRSFAMSGLRWSVKSRKIICIQSDRKEFDDYEEMMHVAKHEFGHALGLGDLYQSIPDTLVGVEKGTYAELDSYAVTDKFYNLVMCDHHGPVSNNDIEMVILAFKENRMQLFQPMKLKGKISTALGRGN